MANPIILMGPPPGKHKVLVELKDANHHALDHGTVAFVVPEGTGANDESTFRRLRLRLEKVATESLVSIDLAVRGIRIGAGARPATLRGARYIAGL